MSESINKPRLTLSAAQDFLSDWLVEGSLRRADAFIESTKRRGSNFPSNARRSLGLEFLIAKVHLLERELYRARLEQHFEMFIQPIRHLTLARFVQATDPDLTDYDPLMDVWDSALQAYCPHEDFYRPFGESGSKQAVSGQFGSRVAAIFGEGEFSITAALATLEIAAEVLANEESKFLEKALGSVIWKQ